jgi:signal transduction histidine kinase
LEIITKDGHLVPVEISSRPVLRDGVLTGVQGIARDISERKLAQQALYRLNEALEDEVKRIAHALHDEAGQLLASVHLALEQVASEDPQRLGEKILPVKEVLFEIEEQLRRLSHELRPTVLDDFGILAALKFLTEGVARRTGLQIHIESSFEGRLAPAVETTLYRVTQEALNNVHKHARAKNVWILVQANGEVHGSIRDDGVGFDVDAVFGSRGRMGLGLRGVQERLAAVGGKLAISSASNQGTTLLVSIPKHALEASRDASRDTSGDTSGDTRKDAGTS